MALVLQQEAFECGLACLAMILRKYGSTISLDSLKRKFDLSLRGTSVAELIRIANSLKLDATVYLLKPSQLSSIQVPSILYWNGNHYVVLKKIKPKKGYQILDPAIGSFWVSREELYKHYSGYAISFNKADDYQPIKDKNLIKFTDVIREIPKSLFYFWFITFLTFLLHMLVLLFPRYIQKLIDPALSTSNLLDGIKLSLIMLTALKGCEALSHLLRSIFIGRLEKIFTEYLGYKVLKHLLHLPFSFFEKRSEGYLYSRFNAVDKTREILSRGFSEGIVDGLFSILILAIIFLYNFQIGIIISFLTIAYLILNYIIAIKAQAYNQIQIKQRSKESTFLMECLRGVTPIKTFCREIQSANKWLTLHQNHLRTAHKIHFLQSLLDTLRIFFFGTQITLIVVISLSFISSNIITLGMLYALLFYNNSLTKNISSITSKWFDMKMLSTHAEYLSNILSYTTECNEQKSSLTMDKIETIRLDNISFRYHRNEPWILKNVSLTLTANECVMICGPSGYGKSTLLKILMGLLQPTKGKVYINNRLLEPSNILAYRKKISSVMQDDELFSGTIYENISFFDKEISYEKVHECAKLAGIADEIESMPMKHHSYIGGMGVAISGGQKQRILLARALYFNPNVLFLDEAFSNLDTDRENSLSHTLKNLGLTQVIVTHRRESLSIADRVIDIRQFSASSSSLSF